MLAFPGHSWRTQGRSWCLRDRFNGGRILLTLNALEVRRLAKMPGLEACPKWAWQAALEEPEAKQVVTELFSEVRGDRLLGPKDPRPHNGSHHEMLTKFLRSALAPTISAFLEKRRPYGIGGAPKDAVDAPVKMDEPRSYFRALVIDELGELVTTATFRLSSPGGQQTGRIGRSGAIAKDGIPPGVCRISFPSVDEQCRRTGRLDRARAVSGDVGYVPGMPLELPTDEVHRIVVPAFRDLRVEWPLDLLDDEHVRVKAHMFVLKGGSYQATRTAADSHADAEHLLSVVFPDLFLGPTYTLEQVQDDGETMTLFTADFATLFPRASTRPDDWKRHAHREDGPIEEGDS